MEPNTPPAIPDASKGPVAGLAIASLICGLLGFLTAGLTGIAAVITGHLALSAIRKSGGYLRGQGLSIAGLVTGYLTLCILPIAVLAGLAAPVILKNRDAARRVECISNTKQLGLAIDDFEVEYGAKPSDRLAADFPEFAGLTGPKVLQQLDVASGLNYTADLLALPNPGPGDVWYYFPEPMADPSNAGGLLVSPIIGKDRVVLRVDGSAGRMPAIDFSTWNLSGAIQISATRKK